MHSATDIHSRLLALVAERYEASQVGLLADRAYAADLAAELAALRHSYVAVAVTEIATLRAELSAPNTG